MGSVVGLDPSLCSFGVAYRYKGKLCAKAIRAGSTLTGIPRIRYIREQVERLIDLAEPSLVTYEDYVIAGPGASKAAFKLGEATGVIKLLLLDKGIDILIAPPKSMKLFVTGSGGGKSKESKARVAREVEKLTGLSGRTTDEYDAVGLMLMGEAFLDSKLLPRLRSHYKHRALAGCSFLKSVAN